MICSNALNHSAVSLGSVVVPSMKKLGAERQGAGHVGLALGGVHDRRRSRRRFGGTWLGTIDASNGRGTCQKMGRRRVAAKLG